jgi:predicted nucleic acid-binding protein
MILADTSIWVDHFRQGNDELQRSLRDGSILMHPFVLGEIACGNLKRRTEALSDLMQLPSSTCAEHGEVLAFVEHEHLFGTGLSWIDAHLLASARLSGCQLWTLDVPLQRAATRLKLGR